METYGVTFDDPGLVLLQLATNGFVAGSDGEVLGAFNPSQISVAKVTVAESMKSAILLDGENGQTYKYLKDDLEN